MTPSHRHLTLDERFVALTSLLSCFSHFWQATPFTDRHPDWLEQSPELARDLLALSDADVFRLGREPDRLLDWMAERVLGLGELDALLALPVAAPNVSAQFEFSSHFQTHIPGRKWQQAKRFIHALPDSAFVPTTWVDWCAGKSHLGRALAWVSQSALRAVERDYSLCEQGFALAKDHLSEVRYDCCDVLQQDVAFAADEQVVALHACGDLHRTLIRQWAESDSLLLTVSPCCYHLWLAEAYQPLSSLAKHHDLGLSPQQVRLAVQETVTSSARVQRQVDEMKCIRLAFDVLQRELRGVDTYLSTPSLPYSWLSKGEDAIIRELADRTGVHLPKSIDLKPYLTLGRAAYHRVSRLQLAGQVFRRGIELWLVLDLALFLQDAGCEVRLQTFCDRDLTPRNLQLIAMR